MKIFKYLFFLILIVLIGGAIYFATKDGSFNSTETKVINAPAEVVYNNVKDFKSWPQWGPWMEEDENIKIDYAEKTEGEGASFSWTSDVVDDGSMKTVKVIPNKEIDQEITVNTPVGDSKSDVFWYFEDTDTPRQTKVTWGMKGEQSFMEKVFTTFQDNDMESGISKMFASGLNNLEEVVEESMKQFAINVDGITRYSGGYYMYNTTASKQSEVGKKMTPMFGQVTGYMKENNIQPSGMPFTIYNDIDEANGTVIFSAAVPVKDRVITPEGSPVLTGFMESTTAVKTTLKGNYTNLPQAYEKAKKYIVENNLELDTDTNMFEVYVNDPSEVPNPSNWITEVYIPIVPKTKPEEGL